MSYYNYSSCRSVAEQPPEQPRRKRGGLKLIALAAVALLAFYSLSTTHTSAAKSVARKIPAAPISTQALTAMDSSINAVLAANPNIDVSVTVSDLTTGTSRSYGPAVGYEAASVAKLITAVDYAGQVEHGGQQWSAPLEDGDTARTAFYKMIVNSDNTAWQSLNDQLGTNSLAVTAQSIGITDYNLDANTLTTGDIALLLQKLYAGKLLNAADTKLLLGDMKIANENYLIPPVIPKGVAVYHKAGLLDDRVHDAAIIDNGAHPIVVVIFTNGHGTYDFPTRTQIIQTITKAALTAYDIQ